jgi:hypothetical protein
MTEQTVGEFIASHPALLPAEQMVVTIARAQIERGDNPEINVTTALLMAVERLSAPAAVPPAKPEWLDAVGEVLNQSSVSDDAAAAYEVLYPLVREDIIEEVRVALYEAGLIHAAEMVEALACRLAPADEGEPN